MAYRVDRTVDSDRDLEAIFDHLTEAHESFGMDFLNASTSAEATLEKIEDAMIAFGTAPHQGTLHPEILPGLRHVTKDRAVFYFTVDDAAEAITVLAAFFGGQDHRRTILKRLL